MHCPAYAVDHGVITAACDRPPGHDGDHANHRTTWPQEDQ